MLFYIIRTRSERQPPESSMLNFTINSPPFIIRNIPYIINSH